jgi:hypothetical protein
MDISLATENKRTVLPMCAKIHITEQGNKKVKIT